MEDETVAECVDRLMKQINCKLGDDNYAFTRGRLFQTCEKNKYQNVYFKTKKNILIFDNLPDQKPSKFK